MKLLGISASLREASTNTMLVREAARLFEPSEFVLADLNLPLYNQDVEEQGIPGPVQKLCDQILWADAIAISTTEYNKGPSGVLKNALDWVSRPRPAPMVGKPVAPMAAAAGVSGGQRAISTLHFFLIPFQVKLVTNPEVTIGQSYDAFDENGQLKNEKSVELLGTLMEKLKAAV